MILNGFYDHFRFHEPVIKKIADIKWWESTDTQFKLFELGCGERLIATAVSSNQTSLFTICGYWPTGVVPVFRITDLYGEAEFHRNISFAHFVYAWRLCATSIYEMFPKRMFSGRQNYNRWTPDNALEGTTVTGRLHFWKMASFVWLFYIAPFPIVEAADPQWPWKIFLGPRTNWPLNKYPELIFIPI